jgi:hypothetical protein
MDASVDTKPSLQDFETQKKEIVELASERQIKLISF